MQNSVFEGGVRNGSVRRGRITFDASCHQRLLDPRSHVQSQRDVNCQGFPPAAIARSLRSSPAFGARKVIVSISGMRYVVSNKTFPLHNIESLSFTMCF